VLAVEPTEREHTDGMLADTVPSHVSVERVAPISASMTRPLGVGNLVLRSWPSLYAAGRRIIQRNKISLVYFSTTMFMAMPLGRVWKHSLGTPYVLDIQDPWLTDYYETHPESAPPPKYAMARRMNAMLEPWTMRRVDGLISVSPRYLEDLSRRYSWLSVRPSVVLPFGVATADFDLLEQRPQHNRFFTATSPFNGAFVGAVGDFMGPALRVLMTALRRGIDSHLRHFDEMRLFFVGTSYTNDAHVPEMVSPIADRFGLGCAVSEEPRRVPYFQALQILKDAGFLLIVGSNDPAYVASKLQLCILTGKPILAVVHENSAMIPALHGAGAYIATFGSTPESETVGAELLLGEWNEMLDSITPRRPREDFSRFSAREGTRLQSELFNRVLSLQN